MSRTRRKFNSAFKAKVAIEAIKEQRTISELAQEFEIHPDQVSQWKRAFLERSAQVFEGDKKQAEEIERLELEQRLAQQHIGRLKSPHSTFCYRPVAASEQDLAAMRTLDERYQEDPARGTRRMSNEPQKQGFDIGRNRTRRLMQRMRMKTIYCSPRTTVCDPAKYKFPYLLRNLKIARPNQVWARDISYIPMERGYMFLLVIIDWHSRAVVGWSLSNTMEASWVVETLDFAIQRHGKPEIINSDQGSPFTSDKYVGFVKCQGIQISIDGKGRAIDNVIVERFFRTIKYDNLYFESLETGADVQRACHEFIQYYNHKRDHSSIGNQPPMVFYKLAA